MDVERIKAMRESHVKTINWVINPPEKSKRVIEDYVMEKGVKDLLMNYNKLRLNKVVKDNIGVLKRAIQTFDGEIETINFGDVDEGC